MSDSKILENSDNVKSLPLYLPPQETFAETRQSKDSEDSESSDSDFSLLEKSDVSIESIYSEVSEDSEEPEEEEQPKFQQISWQRIVLDQMTNRSDMGYLRYLEARRAEKQEKFEAAANKIKVAALQRIIEELKEQLEFEREEHQKTLESVSNKENALKREIAEQAHRRYFESQKHHLTKSELQQCRGIIADYEKQISDLQNHHVAQAVMAAALIKVPKEAELQKLREELEKARSDLFEMDLDRKEKTMELEAAKKTIEDVKATLKKVLEEL
ncbi:hypothetical protein B9Z55_015734 [Caenorhabditis nigoni]|uniref:Uncharacterized protein n=1 Tax=Caenorhabditis nigoni TaxID=1611254 RepID=A0A2G5UCD8_9PELO|nr:hypothetical protein B9Z55_015734 [Caenorhabditis nigoni]